MEKQEAIDLSFYIKKLWIKRFRLLIVISLTVLLGLISYFLSEKTFTTRSIYVPQMANSQGGGKLGGIASLAGISLNGANNNSNLSPALYPKLFRSKSLLLKIIDEKIFALEESEGFITYREYITEIYEPSLLSKIKSNTLGLPRKLVSVLRGTNDRKKVVNSDDRFLSLTPEDEEVIDKLISQISLEYSEEEGFLTLRTEMNDPFLSAQLAYKLESMLNETLIEFNTTKAQKELNFIIEQFKKAESEFFMAQERLAQFKDRNQALSLESVRSDLQRLQSQFDLKFEIYRNVSLQLEEAKVKLSNDTPVLTVINPIAKPNKKSSPNVMIYVFLSLIIGVLSGSFMILLPEFRVAILDK
ncbi:hypothetical protein [uncultured Roseivirga sp.]|uniref:hypothetical protein n=1 Tax=uncultured Roseivirga sp. TaxID=543088 RepID=UPI000D79937D|nr:hypothetical protein [uncultured Roseivirga sp.]PWL30917.1 MAG: hypothetical protein DCO95_05420 [Roseivirga sp. XM-24bin3]